MRDFGELSPNPGPKPLGGTPRSRQNPNNRPANHHRPTTTGQPQPANHHQPTTTGQPPPAGHLTPAPSVMPDDAPLPRPDLKHLLRATLPGSIRLGSIRTLARPHAGAGRPPNWGIHEPIPIENRSRAGAPDAIRRQIPGQLLALR